MGLSVATIVQDPALKNWIKWVVIFLAAKIPKPLLWSSFLALHPKIRQQLFQPSVRNRLIKYYDSIRVDRRLRKTSNLVSCILLYLASSSNTKIPNDYLSIYLWINYYGNLNPPSAKNIVISPQYSKYLKLDYYKSKTLTKLYDNKEYIIYPLIFGQILSNYLTPTKFKLNQRYLSSSIKSRILNPIWINYSLGVGSQYLDWVGLLKSYSLHHLMLGSAIGLVSFKSRILDRYYALKYQIHTEESWGDIIRNYVSYVSHTTNSYVNFIYAPNLISILMISVTAPMLASLNNPNFPIKPLHLSYTSNSKNFFKLYTKIIGFIAGFITIYLNDIDLVPDFGYKSSKQIGNEVDSEVEGDNIRKISKSFLNALNLYLFRLILLSKWRIIKENHPSFKLLKLATWRKLETLVACYGIYKIMNLNDFIKHSKNQEDYAHLKKDYLVRMVDKIM
ncbi:hypothetical protein DFJ63DRAFT_61329 [Scheffersomyces coipomensis]|uniref:uncharacterized protein n=1 Tax=Scheffersomyces coipomensis TaxID=1788519 RepID=UPI00315CC43E